VFKALLVYQSLLKQLGNDRSPDICTHQQEKQDHTLSR